MRWDAKIVLINVDLPKPVCPSRNVLQLRSDVLGVAQLTNTYDIELKASLEQLLLDLLGNAVKSDMAFGYQGPL